MAATASEKILARHAGQKKVAPGEFVEAKVDLSMAHESARIAIQGFRQMGAKKVLRPKTVVLVLDHRAPAECEETAGVHRLIRDFVKEQHISNFYDVGEGVCHQLLAEKGHVRPGALVVGADSHTPTAGALGAFATGVGPTDVAAVWATGKIWLRVPETTRINVNGRFHRGVGAMDLALTLVGKIGAYGAEYRAIEYGGSTIAGMGIGQRMTLCNLSTEMGAKAAMVEPDEKTMSYLADRCASFKGPAARADPGANYERKLELRAAELEPMVARPHSVDKVGPVGDAAGRPVDQAVLGSCSNGRLEDLASAAGILKGRNVARGVRFIVVPASRTILLEAIRKGFIGTLLEAGAVLENPGCGPCLGAHQGILAPDETCISTTSRNFQGRMGSPDANIYLASPATVAASALRGVITDPRTVMR
jgi:3-isopropylmalate/(R)-2-methylmalate dehydratase large subunit